jgi:hypothetical protein
MERTYSLLTKKREHPEVGPRDVSLLVLVPAYLVLAIV